MTGVHYTMHGVRYVRDHSEAPRDLRENGDAAAFPNWLQQHPRRAYEDAPPACHFVTSRVFLRHQLMDLFHLYVDTFTFLRYQ